jgi:tetratricopeptide (TPR) repeat protein
MPILFETTLSLEELTSARFEYELYFNLGHAALWSGDFDQAVAAFTRALEADSRCLDAHHNLGVLRLLRNEPEAARGHFAAAAALAAHTGLPYDAIRVTDDSPVSDALQAAAWRSVRLPAYLGCARHLEHFLPAMIRQIAHLRRIGAADAALGIRDLMVAYTVQHPDVTVEVMTAIAAALCQLGWRVEGEAVRRRAIMTG